MRKAKAKHVKKMALKRLGATAMRAHLRNRRLCKKGEAGVGEATTTSPGLGEVPPIVGELGEVTPPAGLELGEVTPVGLEGGEAPGTPEPLAEVPWPAPGVRVAVGVEHLLHALRLGDRGVSEGAAPDDPLEVIVQFDTAEVLTPLRIPRAILVPAGVPMRNMRYWDKTSEAVKRGLLLKVGVRDPRDEELQSHASGLLTMWGEFLPTGLSLDEGLKVKFVPPAFVKAWDEAHEVLKRAEAGDITMSFAGLEEVAQRQEFRQKLLRAWRDQSEVFLVCMCDEASATSSLLAVRKTPMSVRYYEAPATKSKASWL